MLRFLSALLTLPLTLLVVDFAVSNRQSVALELFPLPGSLELPLFLPVVVVAVLGLMVGGLLAWLGGHRHRAAARRERKRADKLAADLAEARTEALLRPEARPDKIPAEPMPPLLT